MSRITRRGFLAGSATAGTALWLPGLRPLGSNEDIRVACVGVRGQGNTHIKSFERLDGVRVVALCDVDPAVLAQRTSEHEERTGRKIDGVADVRRLLERADIDVIAIATPNHWHALMGIWACQAGKDVYVEKPISHNVWEGRQLVRAARAHDRIVQGGTQSRSAEGAQQAVAFVHAGELGAIRRVRGLCFKPRQSIGKVGKGEIPPGLDYDLWCGPAPNAPLARNSLHYDWHWVYATGNGDMGNQGIHQMDVARWMLGVDALAPSVVSVGGRLGYDDDGETPNTQVVFFDYDPAPLIFETRGLPRSVKFQGTGWGKNMDPLPGFPGKRGIGVVVECQHGSVALDAGGNGAAFDGEGVELRKFRGGGDHYANFIAAVRSRKREDLNADVLETHLSSALCHTGMVSHLLGEPRPHGDIAARLRATGIGDRYEAMHAHLAANGVDLSEPVAALGPWLRMDPASERFVDHDAANALLTREYREGFVVPGEV